MTRKQFDKKYRRVRNAFIKILAVTMFLLFLLSYFNSHKLITALVKRSNEQTIQTQQLEQEVSQLQVSNARLESNIAYEHSKVQQLSNKSHEIKINYKAKQEEPTQDKVHIAEPLPSPDFTTVIIGTLATLGGIAKEVLIPSF